MKPHPSPARLMAQFADHAPVELARGNFTRSDRIHLTAAMMPAVVSGPSDGGPGDAPLARWRVWEERAAKVSFRRRGRGPSRIAPTAKGLKFDAADLDRLREQEGGAREPFNAGNPAPAPVAED